MSTGRELELDVLQGVSAELAGDAADAAREIRKTAAVDPFEAVQLSRAKCAELARRVRTLANFQLDALEPRERKHFREVLYELAGELEDL